MILLHGSNSAGAEMAPLAEAFEPNVQTRAPNLIGHGGRPIPERFSIREFAEDVVAYLDREGIDKTFITGYSTGGYIALYLARHHPQRLRGVVALATKHVFDAETVKHWVHLVEPARLGRPGNPRKGELEKAHAPQDWTAVALRNARLFEDLGRNAPLGTADLAAITVPVMLVSSDRDSIVPWPEMLALGKLIPGSHLAMFYGAAHPLKAVPVHAVERR